MDKDSSNNSDSTFEEMFNKLCEQIDFWVDYEAGSETEFPHLSTGSEYPESMFEDVMSEAESIAQWYSITQSLMKMLYKLEQDGKLTTNQKRIYHEKRKLFGWDKVKSDGDMIDSKLNRESPYTQLVWLMGRDCMAYRREEKAVHDINERSKQWQKDYDKKFYKDIGDPYMRLTESAIITLAAVMHDLRNLEKDGGQRVFIDEDSGVSDLYRESKELEAQALKDIKDVKVLSQRLDELIEPLERDPAMRARKVTEENGVIYKAIQLGYTAGLNANTTEMLRKMKADNGSCNSN